MTCRDPLSMLSNYSLFSTWSLRSLWIVILFRWKRRSLISLFYIYGNEYSGRRLTVSIRANGIIKSLTLCKSWLVSLELFFKKRALKVFFRLWIQFAGRVTPRKKNTFLILKNRMWFEKKISSDWLCSDNNVSADGLDSTVSTKAWN